MVFVRAQCRSLKTRGVSRAQRAACVRPLVRALACLAALAVVSCGSAPPAVGPDGWSARADAPANAGRAAPPSSVTSMRAPQTGTTEASGSDDAERVRGSGAPRIQEENADSAASAGSEAVPGAQQGVAAVCSDPEDAFAVLQERIFDHHSCSAAACHGVAGPGALSLAKGEAYHSLVDADSVASDLPRMKKGVADESFLYLKLRAATEPGSVSISGSPMPSGLAPLSADELEAVRAWIDAGAPPTGPVAAPAGAASSGNYVASLLCESSAVAAVQTADDKELLAPPAPNEGIQFKMPAQEVNAGSEYEGCFATYYDVTEQVPDEFKSPDGQSFFVNATVMRFATGTHHTAATLPKVSLDELSDPAFGAWTCRGGERRGDPCDPAQMSACGEGVCTSTSTVTTGCIGYGPPGTDVNSAGFGLVQALNADAEVAAIPGVYREVPLKAVVFWDFHGVNLKDQAARMNGRINLTYATERKQLERRLQINGNLDGEAAVPPFKRQRLCNVWTAAKGTEIIRLTSHTHHRTSNFRAWGPDGSQIYENHSYSEPAYITFDPAIRLDAEADEDRQIKFCADFNNGLDDNGKPDLDLLCQVSETPEYELPVFAPSAVACSTGKWGAPCTEGFGDEQCDTTPGAGDGNCDAANIHYSTTSAGEMFLLSVDSVIAPEAAQEESLVTSYIWAESLPNQDL